jgi:hypothetical protein
MIATYLQEMPERDVPWSGDRPGLDFIRAFENRWSHRLSKQTPELHTLSQAKSLSEKNIRDCFALVDCVYRKGDLHNHPERCFNLDESRFSTDEKAKRCFYKRGARNTPILNPSCGKTMYTVLVCGSAVGNLLPPFVIYKGKFIHDTWCFGGPKGTHFGVSKSGWMEDYLLQNWLEKVNDNVLLSYN